MDHKKVNESFSDNALKMMKKRYLVTNDEGRQETPAQMFSRVASALADVEKKYGHNGDFIKKVKNDFFDIMSKKEFTPAGRTLRNAGADTSLIANCIVLPVEDSMDGIFKTLRDAALLQQAGSGLGFSFDNLRPALFSTKRTQGVASGPVSFLKVYNEAFGTIKQQGRHGANMAMMSIDHPDVLDFVRSKVIEGEISNFNISVKVTDEFMRKLEEAPDDQWYCTWKDEKMKPRKVIRHPNGVVADVEELNITVGEIFDEIVNYAWTNGEPGIVFIDEVNRTNPLPGLGDIPSSNPCGEQFLHPYDNCNLGSINLSAFVKNGNLDANRLKKVTKIAVRLLDNVIDKFDFPVKEVNETAVNNRRIGLGIMGFADMLYQMGIQYNSKEGMDIARRVMSIIQEAADEQTKKLAKEKSPFPNYEKSIFSKGDRRNAALTTVAPTGSISMMFDTSSGIEPNFALYYVKTDKDGNRYTYLNKYFLEALEKADLTEDQINKIKEEVTKEGTVQDIEDIPQDIKDTFVVAMDIPGIDHIKVQSAFQENVDNSISKTINLPNEATHDDVKNSFMQAWKMKCKSCTVYRDGSREIQILWKGKSEKDIKSMNEMPKKGINKEGSFEDNSFDKKNHHQKLTPRERPETVSGNTYKVKTGYGNLYITVNNDENGEPFEVFTTIGKTGGFFQEQSEAISRLISLSLRAGLSTEKIIDQIKGIRGPMPIITNKGTVLSLPDAIARILEEHIGKTSFEEETEEVKMEELAVSVGSNGSMNNDPNIDIADYGMMPGCPDCGGNLRMAEGCLSCPGCGYSRCG